MIHLDSDDASENCPGCKRPYDDDAVKCDPIPHPYHPDKPCEQCEHDDVTGFCVVLNGYVNSEGGLV